MASRNELVIRGNAVGLTASSYPNDSKFEQKILYLEKNGTTYTATLGTQVLTSDATANADGETVTIGNQVYTFRTALTAATTSGEVLIGANAAASLTNLKAAINGTGTAGTDYGSQTPIHTQVTATTLTATALTVQSRESAFDNASIATTETGAHLSWGAATLASGVRGVIAVNTTTSAGSAGVSGDKNVL